MVKNYGQNHKISNNNNNNNNNNVHLLFQTDMNTVRLQVKVWTDENKLLQESNLTVWQLCKAPIHPTIHFTSATWRTKGWVDLWESSGKRSHVNADLLLIMPECYHSPKPPPILHQYCTYYAGCPLSIELSWKSVLLFTKHLIQISWPVSALCSPFMPSNIALDPWYVDSCCTLHQNSVLGHSWWLVQYFGIHCPVFNVIQN